MTTLIEMIDARHVLADEIQAMETKLAEVDHEIACQMLSNGFERAYGNDGRGFSINRPAKHTFPRAAINLVRELGLSDHFSQLRVTKTAVDDAFKTGLIDNKDYGQLMSLMQTEEGAIGLRKVVDKEKVVK